MEAPCEARASPLVTATSHRVGGLFVRNRMGRFDTSYHHRRAARAKSYRKKRARSRRRKVPTARRALSLAKRNASRIPRPEPNTWYYMRQLDMLHFASQADLQHSYAWAINHHHPYGALETYWSDATSGIGACSTGLQYLKFRFPPVAVNSNVVDPSAAFGSQQVATAIPSTGQNAPESAESQTIALSGNAENITVTFPSNEHGTFKGLSLNLKGMHIYGDIFIDAQGAGVGDASTLIASPEAVNANVDKHRFTLRVVAVQHFKTVPNQRELSPADVFKYPIATATGPASINFPTFNSQWFRRGMTKKLKLNSKTYVMTYDDNRADPQGLTAPHADNGSLATRTVDFKILQEHQMEFSSLDVNTHLKRRTKINMFVRPAQKRLWWLNTDSGSSVDATEYGECMNPVHIWVMVDKSSIADDGTIIESYSQLMHRLNVAAHWYDDC